MTDAMTTIKSTTSNKPRDIFKSPRLNNFARSEAKSFTAARGGATVRRWTCDQ